VIAEKMYVEAVQVKPLMSLEEILDRLAFVGREVVSGHVDLLATRLVSDDVGEERYKLSRGVSRCDFTCTTICATSSSLLPW
jgi:hypothetical protein